MMRRFCKVAEIRNLCASPLWPHRESVRLFTYVYGHSVQEDAGSRLGRGTIVGGVVHPTRQLARYSPPNLPFILNSKLGRISLRGEAVNYRPSSSPSFEVASHVNKLPFRPLLLFLDNVCHRKQVMMLPELQAVQLVAFFYDYFVQVRQSYP